MLFIYFSSLYQILDIIRHKVILKLASRENSSEDDPEKIFFFLLSSVSPPCVLWSIGGMRYMFVMKGKQILKSHFFIRHLYLLIFSYFLIYWKYM